MTYKDKFEASEHKAHYKNIATKILKEMSDLRAKVDNSPTIARRWIWELIQNAKDVAPASGVDIKVDFRRQEDAASLLFKHTGLPFTADNIRFLIEQISSKDREKDSSGKNKSTGKFGTGFLTTHMLSELVTVRGLAKEDGLEHRKFKVLLDRSGHDLSSIMKGVEAAKETVSNLDAAPPYHGYKDNILYTSFEYPLIDSLSIKVAKKGLTDLENCLPFSLSFVQEINSVQLTHEQKLFFKQDVEEKEDSIQIISIEIEDTSGEYESEIFQIAMLTNDFTSIAVPVEVTDDGIEILPIGDTIPKLFCDFPLIGTEDFPFPVIINNPNFNPTDPRDGIYLTDSSRTNSAIDENKKIISDALNLYFKLLEHASVNRWANLHLLACISSIKKPLEWVSESWFEKYVLSPVRENLLHANIITTANDNLASILNSKGEKFLWFPTSGTKKNRLEIWNLANDWFPHCLPRQEDVEFWSALIWKDCGKLTFSTFAGFLEQIAETDKLKIKLKKVDVFEWLNDFYKLLKLDDKEYHAIMDKSSIIPNQNGDFCKKNQLSKDAGDIDPLLKDILTALGKDIRAHLADEEIEMDFDDRIIDKAHIVREITTEINEKANNRNEAKSHRTAFNLVLSYFKKYPQKSEEYFPTIFRNKHVLFDEEEVIENMDKAEQFNDLLDEFNVSNASELRDLIAGTNSIKANLLPVTQDILLSMGITSIDEWHKALEDKDLKVLFSHSSVPTQDMFIYAQSHIDKATNSVKSYLEQQQEYDLSEMEQIAPTILAGIYKHEQPLSIVVRPAYNSEVIIYYGAERDVLDYEPSELWIDNGTDVKQISLGHILKTAEIRKFPI